MDNATDSLEWAERANTKLGTGMAEALTNANRVIEQMAADLDLANARVAELEAVRQRVLAVRDEWLSLGEDDEGPHPIVDQLTVALGYPSAADPDDLPYDDGPEEPWCWGPGSPEHETNQCLHHGRPE